MINRSMIQASVTMGQLQSKLDLIGNNLANGNTTGYKSRQADFSSLLYQQIDNLSSEPAPGNRQTPDGVRIGSGASLGHTNVDLSQGSLQNTGRELDIALLEKSHLFQLQIPTEAGLETQYTRAGNFYLNPVNDNEVMLTDSEGYPVIGDAGDPIVLENGFAELKINEKGSLVVTRDGQSSVEGQLGVVEAVRPRMLEAAGGNRFKVPSGMEGTGIIAEVSRNETRVQNQSLESSNVDISKQMTDMLNAQRAYQFNAKSISTGDQMMGLINQLRS
ncbi:flagellar hook-basal body protein [Halobacillus halophilus]|uniref:flagellar hook-basal body protein n=1 Tax=Halobacillus halophilus TaxID=1570 RepID=UPI001CD3126D|nr:flagellar hook-basal body protein [Halobacillus halophilus]MCA1010878.1 flagellar hook-basal body protein [Halobacillus halophilus]